MKFGVNTWVWVSPFTTANLDLLDKVARMGYDLIEIAVDDPAIRKLGKGGLGHFHSCENDRGTPGTGHQDWTGIRDALREVEYDGAVVIESFTPGAVEIAKAASTWRPLAPSQNELAQQGLVFLKGLLG